MRVAIYMMPLVVQVDRVALSPHADACHARVWPDESATDPHGTSKLDHLCKNITTCQQPSAFKLCAQLPPDDAHGLGHKILLTKSAGFSSVGATHDQEPFPPHDCAARFKRVAVMPLSGNIGHDL